MKQKLHFVIFFVVLTLFNSRLQQECFEEIFHSVHIHHGKGEGGGHSEVGLLPKVIYLHNIYYNINTH